MLTKRIIPCLDIREGKVVKGEQFVNIRYAGNAVECAKRYNEQEADELVFLDITASYEKREILIETVKDVAKQIFIPFTVGGGINSISDIRKILSSGADKISMNTFAVKNPELIKEASEKFGRQCIVVAIDAKRKGKSWEVYIHGGRTPTGLDVIKWAKKAETLGAGEILLTSMDKDGIKEGYDIELTRKVSEAVNIPVIASGGAGELKHIYEVLTEGKADAALVASIVHYKKYTVKQIKNYLRKKGILVR